MPRFLILAFLTLLSPAAGFSQEARPFVPEAKPVEATSPDSTEPTVAEPVEIVAETPKQQTDDATRLYLMASGTMAFSSQTSGFDLPFFVQDVGPATISVGLLTGPGLSPQHSEAVIKLNETIIAKQALDADFNGRFEVEVPAEILVSGRNVLNVKVKQNDAGCRVSPEVWAELRPASTYVSISASLLNPLWINPGPDAFVDVTIQRSEGEDKASAAAAMTAAMRLGHKLSKARLRLTTISASDPLPENVDLLVSTSTAPAEKTQGGPLRINVQQVDTLIPNAFTHVVNVTGGESRNLRDFGVIADGWEDSTYSRVLYMHLPDTFLSMASGHMRFVMNGSTERDLGPEAVMLVKINEQISASAPLPPNWGRRENWGFDVPMRHVRPGLNRVELIVQTPSAVCGAAAGGRTALFGDSRIEFPGFGEAERLSITRLLTEDPTYVVMDAFSNADVSIVSTMLMRLARNQDFVPSVEIAPASDWLESKNALIFSGGQAGTNSYEGLFDVSPDEALRWRTAIRQRLNDLRAQESEADASEMQTWAREVYAYRSVDTLGENGGVLGWAKASFDSILGVNGVNLRGDDEAFVVARRTDGGATHVLLSVADPDQWRTVTDAISKSRIFAWDGRAAHIELDQNIRVYRDQGLPTVKDRSLWNLRLVLADVMSGLSYLFVIIIIFLATLLGVLTTAILPRKDS